MSEFTKAHIIRVSGFLGLPRGTVGLLAMVVLVGMGERMAERFLPCFFSIHYRVPLGAVARVIWKLLT